MDKYPCMKIYQFDYHLKKLERIKYIIKSCENDRYKIIENVEINKIEKKNLTKDLDKKLEIVKNKYVLFHSEFYELINEIIKYECFSDINRECTKDALCMSNEDNNRVRKTIKVLFNKITKLYGNAKSDLIRENELCLYKINKIKKINFF